MQGTEVRDLGRELQKQSSFGRNIIMKNVLNLAQVSWYRLREGGLSQKAPMV